MEFEISPEVQRLIAEAKQAVQIDPSYLIDMLNACGKARKTANAA